MLLSNVLCELQLALPLCWNRAEQYMGRTEIFAHFCNLELLPSIPGPFNLRCRCHCIILIFLSTTRSPVHA